MMSGWFMPKNDNIAGDIKKLRAALDDADAVIIGAGAGLSTAAGLCLKPTISRAILRSSARR